MVRLWRSIILSSLGQTTYPYCLWIKALRLGSLESLLEDIARDSNLTSALFAPPLETFDINNAGAVTRRAKGRRDIGAVVNMVGDKVTEFVKEAADKEDKVVALASLEGYSLPRAYLATWVSRLSLLTSLTLRDGSVLGPEVAEAISQNCPSFRELVCHWCLGVSVDKNLAAFFRGLPPNSVESFSLISLNDIGEKTFQALDHHSGSLRELALSCIRHTDWRSLNALANCTGLVSLALEAYRGAPPVNWETDNRQSFLEVVAWLKQCTALKKLDMDEVPSATSILAEVLKSPGVCLRSLKLKLVDSNDAFYASLGHQVWLRSLSLRTNDELLDFPTPIHAQLVDSICSCAALVELDLITVQLTFKDLLKFRNSLDHLEDLSFDGELLGDAVLLALARMDNLKTVNINALSTFTFQGILECIETLRESQEHSGASHEGFRLYIMSQNGTDKFSDEEEVMLATELDTLGGRLDIQYYRDPDEMGGEENDWTP